MRKWNVKGSVDTKSPSIESIIQELLRLRNIVSQKDIDAFFHPVDPTKLTPLDVGIDAESLTLFLARIKKAIDKKESVVVYADYDADGITAGAVLWEALYALGMNVMPYIPHRKEEGYGFSEKGLQAVKNDFNPTLIISVDHGITAESLIPFAQKLGMEIIVSDHHMKPEKLPECLILHTTTLSGAGIAFFLANYLLNAFDMPKKIMYDLLPFAAIGTIADMVPLVGANRSIALYGLKELNISTRVGLKALVENSGLTLGNLKTYSISHMLAPRLNAMGRLTHAMDALRLLCTKSATRAAELALVLGSTNKERQGMTTESVQHAKGQVSEIHGEHVSKRILIISHESYDQGIIGLIAGRLMEEYYRPAIVLSVGQIISKASARSIQGFNIVEAIREFQELLIDVGGHPLAAGFTIETKNIPVFQEKMEQYAQIHISDETLSRFLTIDLNIPMSSVSEALWEQLQAFEPYGLGNPEPVFVTRAVQMLDVRTIGKEKNHLKFSIPLSSKQKMSKSQTIAAIAFNQALVVDEESLVDIAYTIDMNEWNGRKSLQINVRDISIS